MLNKRAVSPLIATVLLVMIVVSIGAAVMLVIRGISDDNLDKINTKIADINCGTDVAFKILAIGVDNQICKDDILLATGNIATILTNNGAADIEDFKLTVIGPNGIYDDSSQLLTLDKDETKALNFSFLGNDTGGIREIRIIPIISGTPGDTQVACIDRALIKSNASISTCPLP